MKKLSYISMFILASCMFISTGAKAQVVIKVRPEWHEDAHYVRPVAPHQNYIWVDGGWKWNRREHHYVHVPGYWVAPRPGWVWVPGHWMNTPDGDEWHAGHWSRRY